MKQRANEITGSEEACGFWVESTLFPRVFTLRTFTPSYEFFSLNALSTNCQRDCEILRLRCSLGHFLIVDFLQAHAQRGPQVRAQSGRKSPVCSGVR